MMLADYVSELTEKGYIVEMRYHANDRFFEIRVTKDEAQTRTTLDENIFFSDDIEDIIRGELKRLTEELG